MIVTFISQCEKKALARTRRVLDAFANRIGDNTWQTIITEEGLIAVKKLLRKTVTKSTAVSCHWIRSRRRSELLWIVGNRNKFNEHGIVPVNTTKKSLIQSHWENDWHYLPLIKALVALAALLHDWGKACDIFQTKLRKREIKGDPLRHEWLSCLILNALVKQSGDTQQDDAWLNLFINQAWDEDALIQSIANELDKTRALDQLPPMAQLISWLILSHHRLPDPLFKISKNSKEARQYKEDCHQTITSLFSQIAPDWGYQNKFDEQEYNERLKSCFMFNEGLLSRSTTWLNDVKKWAIRLLQEKPSALTSINDGSWRIVLHHARLCLMLGDHYYSSLNKEKNNDWQTPVPLIANTKPDHSPKQYLDQHLIGVSKHALQAVHSLSRLSEEMESAYDLKKLKRKSPAGFEWQDHAVTTIKKLKQQKEFNENSGWFIVNMASTGKGKTIANAKIMQALSKESESLRYILALGLRTLTLQTGDAYRHDIDLQKDELAVLIGSKAVQELHQKNQQSHQTTNNPSRFDEIGSESLDDLLDNELDYDAMPQADFLNVLFADHHAERNKAFLYKPVLVCTIDHIITATETRRGGKYILPCLRLLSSDLVIDEVDDFSTQDLIAIQRLIHLAGLLGRKVMISSATIPPGIAEGLFNQYQAGYQLYTQFKRQKSADIVAMWVDEFKSQTQTVSTNSLTTNLPTTTDDYKSAHDKFIISRALLLAKQPIKHKPYYIVCEPLKSADDHSIEAQQIQYAELIKEHIQRLHSSHHTIDKKTGKKVSFGVVRMANIGPCVAITQHLLNAEWAENVAPRIMAYHSRQILLLRSEQEHHLDDVLTRKEKTGEQPRAFSNSVIRQHLDTTDAENVIFILVATPVEEVGRDHDFDWAIIEPSSYRSIIQLSGRILRHRKLTHDIQQPNIGLLQYNLKGLQNADVAFSKPGFEMNNDHFKLKTKDLMQLLDESILTQGINAIPRIQANNPLQIKEKLADLEHGVSTRYLASYDKSGPHEAQSWIDEVWFLTALSQRLTPFRESQPDIKLVAKIEEGHVVLNELDDDGNFYPIEAMKQIHHLELTELEKSRLWLYRDYQTILTKHLAQKGDDTSDINDAINRLSKRYGEILMPTSYDGKSLVYSDQFGLTIKR